MLFFYFGWCFGRGRGVLEHINGNSIHCNGERWFEREVLSYRHGKLISQGNTMPNLTNKITILKHMLVLLDKRLLKCNFFHIWQKTQLLIYNIVILFSWSRVIFVQAHLFMCSARRNMIYTSHQQSHTCGDMKQHIRRTEIELMHERWIFVWVIELLFEPLREINEVFDHNYIHFRKRSWKIALPPNMSPAVLESSENKDLQCFGAFVRRLQVSACVCCNMSLSINETPGNKIA